MLVAVVLIGAAPAAAANAPATSGPGSVETQWAGGPATRSSAAALPTTTRGTGVDRLPFSDIDFAFAVLVAGGLVLLGAGLRRLTARAPQN
jgi:hypothetical protein